MKWPCAFAMLVVGAAALGDDVSVAKHAMRAAMLERAPVPSQVPALPDRASPGLLHREQVTARAGDARRAAHGHAVRGAGREVDAVKADAANRAAMGSTRRDHLPASGCSDASVNAPADMMKSRGRMAGGGAMAGAAAGPGGMGGGGMGGAGMPGGGTSSGGAAGGTAH
jgi:hypothetical protein